MKANELNVMHEKKKKKKILGIDIQLRTFLIHISASKP